MCVTRTLYLNQQRQSNRLGYKLRKLNGKDAEQLAKDTVNCLKDWKPLLHTITSDNGKEFSSHQMIAQELNIDFFFAKPYANWQRGLNENYNRLVIQYIPKKVDFDHMIVYIMWNNS